MPGRLHAHPDGPPCCQPYCWRRFPAATRSWGRPPGPVLRWRDGRCPKNHDCFVGGEFDLYRVSSPVLAKHRIERPGVDVFLQDTLLCGNVPTLGFRECRDDGGTHRFVLIDVIPHYRRIDRHTFENHSTGIEMLCDANTIVAIRQLADMEGGGPPGPGHESAFDSPCPTAAFIHPWREVWGMPTRNSRGSALERPRRRYEATDTNCPECGYVDEEGNWTGETDGRRVVYHHVCPSCGAGREHVFRRG